MAASAVGRRPSYGGRRFHPFRQPRTSAFPCVARRGQGRERPPLEVHGPQRWWRGARRRSRQVVLSTEEAAGPPETRLFDAPASYVTQNAGALLVHKNKFCTDYVHGAAASEPSCPVLPAGDLAPYYYHMPGTVVFGETGNVAVVVGLINRAGGFLEIQNALWQSEYLDFSKAHSYDVLSKPCVVRSPPPHRPHTLVISLVWSLSHAIYDRTCPPPRPPPSGPISLLRRSTRTYQYQA